ncbi:NAD(+) synthase [Aristophania vespae]|uniref:NAD(+) synthase n=1 Tax=Aristophania vespae TaxID=2697033 RepID=UPI002351A689|nr:NAD(+) synthase [Aristophania vespae]UMM64103.1 Glutamine-dependent NAD(+) synthetase [Aristophania vespae]
MDQAAFKCLYEQGFARVAACTVPVTLADPHKNGAAILDSLKECDQKGVAVAVFPELALSGYSIGDLLFQQLLLQSVEEALEKLVKATSSLMSVAVVGAPLKQGDGLYNCAVIIHRGRILGVVPKTYLPRYREFYEPRHFLSGKGVTGSISLCGQLVPFGTDLLFQASDISALIVGVEICEDLWAPLPPSTILAMGGATVIANLSASPVTIGRMEDRLALCSSQSRRVQAAYIYAAAGPGESTTDLAWDGQLTIHEAGSLLEVSERFPQKATSVIADIDLTLLQQERLHLGYFTDESQKLRVVSFQLAPTCEDRGFLREIPRFPFVPNNPATLAQDCQEAWMIQVQALCQRLVSSGAKRMIIGVSGGLDSALALLVAVKSADALGWPRKSILARTMPGFATGKKSLSFAQSLMADLDVEGDVLDIRQTALSMLKEIKHPFAEGEPVHDVTFENVQAGLRTDFLFRLANFHNGLVIGTGDLSEIALGWCTYGVGDQMAHYNVNSGIPKTLIQHIIRWAAQEEPIFPSNVRKILKEIVESEISPELVPESKDGIQKTEQIIGPYALQDFTLYYVLRHGFSPQRIAFLQEKAWGNHLEGNWPIHYPESEKRSYSLDELIHWMKIFISRFFGTSQFKRSAMPNGPKVVAGGSLSPRGDWRAPSDGKATLWLNNLEQVKYKKP